MTYLDQCLTGSRAHVEPSQHGVAWEDEGRDGEFTIDGLTGLDACLGALPVQRLRRDCESLDAIAGHAITQFDLDAGLTLYRYQRVIDDLRELQAHFRQDSCCLLCYCCRWSAPALRRHCR